MAYTVGSLFAGVGGICLGFKKATYGTKSYNLLWANEIDEYACATYSRNFDHLLLQGDIEKIVKPEREKDPERRMEYVKMLKQILENPVDVLTAGFPCQAFSIAGNRQGFDDERGNLFWSIVGIIKLLGQHAFMPRVLFLENVKNLKGHDKGRTYRIIRNELIKLGYTVREEVLNTKDYSTLPQNRERIYIVAFLEEEVANNFTLFDELEKYVVHRTEEQRRKDIERIIDLGPNKPSLEKYYYTKERYPHYFLTEEEYLAIPESERKEHRINIEEEITEMYEFYQVRRGMYIRKNQSGVCPTLTANMGTGGHNVALVKVADGIRKLTPEETFRLQGFPVGNGYELPTRFNNRPFPDGQLYKQAGNAVSIDVVRLIASEILKALTLAEYAQQVAVAQA